jgi:hypothetical protein
MNKYGIAQLIVLSNIFATVGSTVSDVLDDGKVNFSDISALMPLLGAFKDLTTLDLNQVVPQLTDLSQTEVQELGRVFSEKFNIANDVLEAKVEAGLQILLKSIDTIKFFRSLV